mgnify:CR=1 FL=1|tara:strand:- start:4816 stop:5379 length:564 start_codon:yes stop_codon:yes gene_type:complete
MAKAIITPVMVQSRIVSNLIKGGVYVIRKGKSIIPHNIDDLPPKMRRGWVNGEATPEYVRAYDQLYYQLVTKPKKAQKSAERKKLKAELYQVEKNRAIKVVEDEELSQSNKDWNEPESSFWSLPSLTKKELKAKSSIDLTKKPKKGINLSKDPNQEEETYVNKIVVKMSETMTCTILANGSITVDFK